jgi:hypothetical protein
MKSNCGRVLWDQRALVVGVLALVQDSLSDDQFSLCQAADHVKAVAARKPQRVGLLVKRAQPRIDQSLPKLPDFNAARGSNVPCDQF